jgi:beta-galactosidase
MRKSFWTDDPVVKLALSDGGGWNQKMHMNWPEGKKLEVTCYTNCEEAELFLNGMSLGKKKVDQEKLIITWNMTFSSGTLSVNGLKDGKIICTEELMTAGKPLNLVLKPIVVHSDKFNHDLIQVEVNMVDKNNTIAPGSISRVEFSLEGEGEILGVCNSNYKSIESYKTNSRLLYEGRCLVIIKAKDKKDIKLNVRSVELDKEYVLSFNDENNNI